jgi:hypothetical protein
MGKERGGELIIVKPEERTEVKEGCWKKKKIHPLLFTIPVFFFLQEEERELVL